MTDDKPIFYDPEHGPRPISPDPEIAELRERICRLEEFVIATAGVRFSNSGAICLNELERANALLDEIKREQVAATCTRSKT